jgi:hypothetical protein
MKKRTVEQLRLESLVINVLSLAIIGLCIARVCHWL